MLLTANTVVAAAAAMVLLGFIMFEFVLLYLLQSKVHCKSLIYVYIYSFIYLFLLSVLHRSPNCKSSDAQWTNIICI